MMIAARTMKIATAALTSGSCSENRLAAFPLLVVRFGILSLMATLGREVGRKTHLRQLLNRNI